MPPFLGLTPCQAKSDGSRCCGCGGSAGLNGVPGSSPSVAGIVPHLIASPSEDRQAWERYCSRELLTHSLMFSRLDCSKYSQHSQQLWELDWLIAEYSERIGDQRHVLSRLADHIGEARVIQKFLEDLLSTQKFYLEERERLLVQHAPSLQLRRSTLSARAARSNPPV